MLRTDSPNEIRALRRALEADGLRLRTDRARHELHVVDARNRVVTSQGSADAVRAWLDNARRASA